MNVRGKLSLVACIAVLLGGTLLATAAAPNIGQNQSATQGSAGVIQISRLIGATVLSLQGQEKLGLVKDVVLDSQTGQASFVILDAEGPGLAHAMLVVPYQALRMSLNPADKRQSLALDVRADQLRAAPQIQNDQWQVLQNPQFLQQARDFYQARTYTAARPIDNAPSLPSLSPAMPPPCLNSADSTPGLPQDLIDFYSE